MRKVLITIVSVIVVLAAAAGIMTISYINSDDYKADVFPEGTIINGVNCSGLSFSRAADELSDSWNDRHLQVVGSLDETLADFTDFGCTYDIDGYLASFKKDHLVAAAVNHYLHIPFSGSITMKVRSCGTGFLQEVKSSDFLHRDGTTETSDAYVDLDNPDFPIIPEVYGTKADPEAFTEDLIHAIEMGLTRFEYDEKAYVASPKIKADDPDLIRYQKFCKKYLNQQITYEFGDDSYRVSSKELAAMMDDNLSGEADSQAVAEFVDKLKKDYDLADGELKFHSLTGRTFKVSRGDCIWVIDAEGETAQLMEDISSHRNVTREPVYSSTGTGKYSRKLEIGNTYVDVDLENQHVTFFKKGRKAFECDCVSGSLAAGHGTPTGVYNITNMGRNITLVGGGKKGSPGYYESFVQYWMAFIGNSIGLHDASWRSESEFGGDTYKYSGSHGCVNLPPSKAGKLYDILDIGTPVIVHY
ncbi:MAG: L,D-transpeptidase family protein [Lentihominibacter sp.]